MNDEQWQPPQPSGAVPPPPASPPPFVPESPPTVAYAPPSGLQFGAPTPPAPSPQKRSRVALGGAVAGVLALGAAATFAVTQFTDGGSSGGADSPEQVGELMMASLGNEDVLGMVDLMLPGERETFRQPMLDMVSELTRLEVLSPDASLAKLAGVDITVDNMAVDVTPTNVADIANIVMTADMAVSIDGERLPIGDLIRDLGEEFSGEPLDMGEADQRIDGVDFELPMTVVEQDGRWYLSIFYTAAEAARTEAGFDEIPAAGLSPRGGSQPEGALDALFDGVERLDLGTIIAALNPNEAEALQRYAPLFLDEAQAALDDVPLRWQITETEYTVTGSGSTRYVAIDLLRIDGDIDGQSFSVSLGDGCARVSAADESFDSCEILADSGDELDQMFGDAQPLQDLVDEVRRAFEDYDPPPGITVDEVDGQWFVSPIGSGFDQLLALLAALDRQEIDAIIDRVGPAVEYVFDEFGFGQFGFEDAFDDFSGNFSDQDFFDDFGDTGDDIVEPPPIGDPPPPSEPPLDDFEQQQQIVETCYSLGDTDAVIDCMRQNIESGLLPEYFLDPELQFPECGLADFVVGQRSLYDLTDAEYTAIITAASECFRGVIESGALQDYEVSNEYLRPECAEGRNPYSFGADDSQEFFDRWLACITG